MYQNLVNKIHLDSQIDFIFFAKNLCQNSDSLYESVLHICTYFQGLITTVIIGETIYIVFITIGVHKELLISVHFNSMFQPTIIDETPSIENMTFLGTTTFRQDQMICTHVASDISHCLFLL